MSDTPKSARIVTDARTFYDAMSGALTLFGLSLGEKSKMTVEFEGRDITFRWKHLAVVMTATPQPVKKGPHPND